MQRKRANMSIQKTIIASSLVSLLAACGGGGAGGPNELYTGSTEAAVVSEDNKAQLAQASALGAKQVISNKSLPIAASSEQTYTAANQAVNKLMQLNALPTGADVSAELCTGGGSATGEGNETKATFSFDKCNVDGIIMSGSGSITTHSDGSIVIVYRNFTMTVGDESVTINVTANCDSSLNCTISSDFVAVNGETYRINDTSFTGNSATGYSISATVFDSELGSVSFTASSMLFNCENGYPSSGSLIMNDAQSNEITVTFDSCDAYTVTLNGNADTLNWLQ